MFSPYLPRSGMLPLAIMAMAATLVTATLAG